MPTVNLRADRLDALADGLVQQRLARPLFINSVPKSGTHLLRNILRMFVSPAQHYARDFVQYPNLEVTQEAFDPRAPMLSCGHLLFTDTTALVTAHVTRLLLVRDPYDWVLARARFFLSENFDGDMAELRDPRLSVDDLLSAMIFGVYRKAPSLNETYSHNAAAWLPGASLVVRFEELRAAARSLDETYFSTLLAAAGLSLPDDWADRVRIGADPAHSGTARDNLSGVSRRLPDTLPDLHRRLVDYEAPGLRRLLGYEAS
ncbi:hypothetical protein GGQ97_002443 [Sphingomonas kaistensis]|uniref:Sulfotransferase domain-containing protein n=1 Tax=Sphingomonas kaistensis TaxID=298708 RepID=A0A7X6BHL2_9SPHN|nr:hypothetical protein [Sphingomonas kaistensis]NJC06650.1 hypothetical protein [Sphingomonas kaistensis]